MTNGELIAWDPHPRRRVAVVDTEMSFVDTGQETRSCFFTPSDRRRASR
jgi:hypothetical protein